MVYTLNNQFLWLSVDSQGAQMTGLSSADGREYLWSGDPEYWMDQAPLLFPFVGRLNQGRYFLSGRAYSLPIHGFASAMDFTPVEVTDTALTLELCSTEETRDMYPFDFSLHVSYRLVDSRVEITYTVENRSAEIMPFGIGGHPGFRVPLEEGKRFEDYVLEFSSPAHPDQIITTEDVYLSGETHPFPLQAQRFLPLHHRMFDNDAITLQNMCRKVSLHADSGPSVVVEFPQMSYLGLWHTTGTDAPFLCIEPWTSLPGRQNILEDLSLKSDLIHLSPGHTYENQWSITILEEKNDV